MPWQNTKTRPEIEADQLAKLRALIAALIPNNRFYTQRFEQAGITPDIESLAAFSERMPFTTKQDLVDDQIAHPPYGSNLTYPLDQYTRYHQTSGTTRKPIRWLDTNEGWQWMLGNWSRIYDAAGIGEVGGTGEGEADRIMFTFSFGPFLGFWTAFECATQRGSLCIPGGGLSSEGRLHMILDNAATAICCTPTYAIRLAEAAAEHGIDLSASQVKKIIVAGEPGGSIPAVRNRIEQLWPGATVVDHHGMTEIGPVSYQNPDDVTLLHCIEDSYLVEVIDALSGKPLAKDNPDAMGELVLTTLGRAGSPLLRYRTGDLVKPVWTAGAEKGDMALRGGVLGRTDDMVVVRSVNVFPSAVEEVMRGFSEVAEYRVEVRTVRAMTELHMQVELKEDAVGNPSNVGPGLPGQSATENDIHRPGRPGPTGIAEQIETAIKAALSFRVPVTIVEPGTLPRFEMKAKRWVKV